MLCPRHNNQELIKLAVSRDSLYRKFKVNFNESEFDIFEIDFCIDYEIQENELIVMNENEIQNYISDFVHSIHSLLTSFGNYCFMQNMEDRDML